jgi:hypothetical protein
MSGFRVINFTFRKFSLWQAWKIWRPYQESNKSLNDEPSVLLHTDQGLCKHSNDVWGRGSPSVRKCKVTMVEHKATAVHLNCLLTHILENWLYKYNVENPCCSAGTEICLLSTAPRHVLSPVHSTQTRSVTHSASYSIGNGVLSLRVRHKDDYPLLSYAQVKNVWAYTSPLTSSWCAVLSWAQGQLTMKKSHIFTHL